MAKRMLSVYQPLPITFTKGEGVWLWDNQGNRYLDAISGMGVNVLGYNQPQWVECLKQQATKLIHVSNLFTIPEQENLAEHLCQKTGMEKAFFANSGAEANECAIKLARLYGHSKGIETPTLIVFEGAYHGRTLATLTASSSRQVQAGFEPLVSGFVRAPLDDMNAIHNIAQSRSDIVGVLIEPVQGQGGVHVANPQFLHDLRDYCNQQSWLLITDEIQSGMGRTGEFLCLQHYGIQADIVTLAKGLANGIPIGACLTQGVANDLFTTGSHGATFGGNPLACALAIKTLELLETLRLAQNTHTQGDHLIKSLQEQLSTHPMVKEIRGQGLMIGIELNKPCKEIYSLALKHQLLLNITQQNVIRLLPPLVIGTTEIAMLSERLVNIIAEFTSIHSKR